MEEKYIVNDVLQTSKSNLKDYESIIVDTSNMELRQTLQNMRNTEESFQYEIFKLAETKGYYQPVDKVDLNQIQKLMNEVNQ